jgi:hypothetical protein
LNVPSQRFRQQGIRQIESLGHAWGEHKLLTDISCREKHDYEICIK